jgi:hypothetical protein
VGSFIKAGLVASTLVIRHAERNEDPVSTAHNFGSHRSSSSAQPTNLSKLATTTMSDEEDIAALVIDNGSGMCKGTSLFFECERIGGHRPRSQRPERYTAKQHWTDFVL